MYAYVNEADVFIKISIPQWHPILKCLLSTYYIGHECVARKLFESNERDKEREEKGGSSIEMYRVPFIRCQFQTKPFRFHFKVIGKYSNK